MSSVVSGCSRISSTRASRDGVYSDLPIIRHHEANSETLLIVNGILYILGFLMLGEGLGAGWGWDSWSHRLMLGCPCLSHKLKCSSRLRCHGATAAVRQTGVSFPLWPRSPFGTSSRGLCALPGLVTTASRNCWRHGGGAVLAIKANAKLVCT